MRLPGQRIALAVAMVGTSVASVLEGQAWFALLMAVLAVAIVGEELQRRRGSSEAFEDRRRGEGVSSGRSSPSERRRLAANCLLTLSFVCAVYVFRSSTLLVVVLAVCIVLTWVQWYRDRRGRTAARRGGAR